MYVEQECESIGEEFDVEFQVNLMEYLFVFGFVEWFDVDFVVELVEEGFVGNGFWCQVG